MLSVHCAQRHSERSCGGMTFALASKATCGARELCWEEKRQNGSILPGDLDGPLLGLVSFIIVTGNPSG